MNKIGCRLWAVGRIAGSKISSFCFRNIICLFNPLSYFMSKSYIKRISFWGILISLYSQQILAGPPFNTDDPEPVKFKHWEYYISTIDLYQSGTWSGTSPHLEVNYGLVTNVQVHLLLPMNYDYSRFEQCNTQIKFS